MQWDATWRSPLDGTQTGQITSQTISAFLAPPVSTNTNKERNLFPVGRKQLQHILLRSDWRKKKPSAHPTRPYTVTCTPLVHQHDKTHLQCHKQLPTQDATATLSKKPQCFYTAMEVIIIQSVKDLIWIAHNMKASVKSENTYITSFNYASQKNLKQSHLLVFWTYVWLYAYQSKKKKNVINS